MAELTKLISYMSLKDRTAVIEKYAQMFDEAEDEEELIAQLGTPVQVAISLADSYIPSPMDDLPRDPGELPQEDDENEEPLLDISAGGEPEEPLSIDDALAVPQATEATPQPESSEFGEQEQGPVFENAEAVFDFGEGGEEAIEQPTQTADLNKRRYKPVLTTIYTILAIVIGLPITIVLICIGIPFITAGGVLVAFIFWLAFFIISGLSMVSDILMCAGIALVVCAIGLVLFWFGLWLSISLAKGFISGCVLRPGHRLCVKKEEASVNE